MGSAEPPWGQQYDDNRPLYLSLEQEILFILKEALDEAGIKTHSVSSRVKHRQSFLEKIERKGYVEPFAQFPDVVGARVVCLFLADLPKLRELVNKWFWMVDEEDKMEQGPLESFGYMSQHYVCQLRQEHTGPRYDRIKHIRFEIQCRTILQDAWANVSHYLAYKGESSIPEDLRKDFHALSGLFYVADQHFQLFFGASKQSDVAAVNEVREPSRGSLSINRPRLQAFLQDYYADREQSPAADVSELVEELQAVGYDTLGQLRARLDAGHSAFLRYEEEHPPTGAEDSRFADVGAARLTLAIADRDYLTSKYGLDDPIVDFAVHSEED